MSRPIVVPLDGSPLAEHALPYATALARIVKAPVILLYARSTDVVPDAGAPDLVAVAARLRADGLDVDTHVCHLPSAEQTGRAILQAANDLAAGLIVMATHGRGGLGRLIYGSVADQVLRQTTLPVMLVPLTCERTLPADRPLRILVPLDGSETASAVLDPLLSLIGEQGAELIALRVVESIDFVRPHGDTCDRCRSARARGEEPDIEPVRARQYVEAVGARLRTDGVAVESQVEIGGATSTIARVARERGADLIAMATRGRGGVTRLVLGSVATATLQQATVPILLVRPSAVRQPSGETRELGTTAARRLTGLRVKDVMTRPVVTIGQDATLEETARLMLDRGIGGVPVVDGRGHLVGIVTESDFCGKECYVPFSTFKLPRLLGEWVPKEGVEAIYRAARTTKARDVMSAPVTTAIEAEPMSNLIRRMIERDLKRLPVVHGAVPVGMITRHDLLRMMTEAPDDA